MDEDEKRQEEQEAVQDIVEIENLQDWLNAVKAQSGQTQEQIKQSIDDIGKDVAALKEVLVALPAVSMAMAQRGLTSAKESIDAKAKATKKRFFDTIKSVKDKAIGVKDSVVQGVKDYKDGVKAGMGEVDQATQAEDMYTARVAMEANSEDRQWAEARKQEGRSEGIADAVQAAKEASRQRRANLAAAKVKVVGFIGKGLVVFGKKGLAKEMIEKVGQSNQRYVEKESRTGKLMQRVAQFGFKAADRARDTRDAVVLGAGIAKDTVIDGVTAVRDGIVGGAKATRDLAVKGAVTLGRGTYKTVGIAAGVVTLAGLETVELGKAVGHAGKRYVVDPAKEAGREVAKTARDTKEFGSKFKEYAKRKIDQVRDVPTSLRKRTSELLIAAADRVTPTLDQQEAAKNRAEIAEKAKKEQAQAFNKMTGRKAKDDGYDVR